MNNKNEQEKIPTGGVVGVEAAKKAGKVYELCRIWSEQSSRMWIGNSSPSIQELSTFLEELEKAGFKLRCNNRGYDFMEIAYAVSQGWTTEEEALPTRKEEIGYDIFIELSRTDEVIRKVHIGRIVLCFKPILSDEGKVSAFDIGKQFILDNIIEWKILGGDGNDVCFFEVPSNPILYTTDWKWFYLEPGEYELKMDFVTTDGAMLLKQTKKAVPAPFNTYYEQLW